MAKEILKNKKRVQQGGKDAFTAETLPIKTKLFDTHRKIPKSKNGTYRDETNVIVIMPKTHMKEHGTLREREDSLEQLKTMMDTRKQYIKLLYSFNNRLDAYNRKVDHTDPATKQWLEGMIKVVSKQVKDKDIEITKHLKSMDNSFVKAALNIKGVGPITIAFLLVYIKIENAEYASSLWSYVGYDKSSHERYTKGEAGGGNKTLRTALYAFAGSMIRSRGAYREVYDREKLKLSNSELFTLSRKTDGKALERMMWKDTMPSHRHDAAIRKMNKHFLADVWKVWRTLEGLPTPYLYVQEKMGHTGIIQPEERGWKYKHE